MPVKIVTLIQLFLFAVSLGLFVMAALTFTRRRQAPQSGLLVLVMCAEAFYCFGYAQEMAQTTLAGAIFWLRVEYIGIPWIPALWVLIGRRHFGLRGRAVLLSIIPVIVAIAEWTNGMHGLYDRSMMLVVAIYLFCLVLRAAPDRLPDLFLWLEPVGTRPGAAFPLPYGRARVRCGIQTGVVPSCPDGALARVQEHPRFSACD